jgi:hypothetical protein
MVALIFSCQLLRRSTGTCRSSRNGSRRSTDFIFVAAWSLSALAFVIAVMARLAAKKPNATIVAPLHFHDLGKLLLALVMLWAYFAFRSI